MDEKTLKEILEKHQKWLKGEEGGECADLSFRVLRLADLVDVNLKDAILRNTNLSNADLFDANLRGADLSGADLRYARLCGANLSGALLHGAQLKGADLTGTRLKNIDFEYVDLTNAKLDPKEQIRKGVCLIRKMIGYKKCKNGEIVKLEIPKGAIVFSINNFKCRTNIAKVLEISNGKKTAVSGYDNKFVYKVGKIVKAKNFNCQYNRECAEGIHFFRTKKEAKEY